MVGVPGLEPGTSRLSVERSNQLSYTPLFLAQVSNTTLELPHTHFFSHSVKEHDDL